MNNIIIAEHYLVAPEWQKDMRRNLIDHIGRVYAGMNI
jgi:hypothetical protein